MTSRSTPFQPANPRALLLIPLAAALAILPLILHGGSCGHDLVFHTQSWLDAAQQLRHGHYPHWAFSPAWNAGEPRFLFYPPLSWLLGAVLITVFPAAAAPILYIWIALTAAGLAMHRLARHFVASPIAALLAAVLYLANPYMLFNAFERSALAELLAAAWIPLLLLAILRHRPTIRGVALPVALLWLTNAPAAVMGCYTLAFLAALRLATSLAGRRQATLRGQAPTLALTYTAGAALGLALPAFYLVPAAFERRFVQVAMAIIPNLRFQDNFLFARTAYQPHNVVTHTISVLAIELLLLTAAVLSALLLLPDRRSSVVSIEGRRPSPQFAPTLALLTLLLTFLLVPLSTPIWNHLPELAFLQFPWRLLTILAAVLGLALALLFDHFAATSTTPSAAITSDTPGAAITSDTPGAATTSEIPGAPFMARSYRDMGGPAITSDTPGAPFMARSYRDMSGPATTLSAAATLLCPLALGFLCFHLYGQACAPTDRPSAVATLFHTHHGAQPTDEYTPTAADNDTLRSDDPGFWLAPNPQAFAPATIPNPNATNPDYDASTPIDQTVSARAPLHLSLDLPRPEALILNLRDYPDWLLTDTTPGHPPTQPAHIPRDDGLLAIALPAGPSTLAITWRETLDQTLGLALSLCALLALALTFRRPA